MVFEISKSDFCVLVAVYNLFEKVGRDEKISRKEVIKQSGVCPSLLTKRIKNVYLKEILLKENTK